jgi:hypothetical protein
VHDPREQSERRRNPHDHSRVDLDAGLREHTERGGRENDPERVAQPDDRDVRDQRRPDPDTGKRADQDRRHQAEIDVPADEMRHAGGPQQDRGVEDVSANDTARAQLVEQDQDEADEGTGADRCQPEHEPERQADQHGSDLADPALKQGGLAFLGDQAGPEERAIQDRG